jgi:hypothetical protein
MPKLAIFLLIAVSLFVSLGFGSNIEAHKTQFTLNNPTATPTPKFSAQIEKIELDKKQIYIPCPDGSLPAKDSSCDESRSISVKTIVGNLDKIGDVSYQYKVSGGNILGQGESVIWDLSEARPGTYTISATINNDENTQKSETITVLDRDCEGCYFCPSLSVSSSNKVVKAGEIINFTADVFGGAVSDITFNWTISEGEIIEGQGTPSIKVKTTAEMAGKNIKATIEIGRDGLCDLCQKIDFQIVKVIK